MRLLVGPHRSGKTTSILQEAQKFIRAGEDDFRLVVPSATMAEHLRNALAREGFAARPSTVVTLSGLVAAFTPDVEEAGGEDLALIISECLKSGAYPAFTRLLDTPGLARSIASNIEDLINSGCTSLEWAALGGMGVWRGSLYSQFGRLWEEMDSVLAARRLLPRGTRILKAIAAVRRGEFPSPVRAIFVDGFFTFSRLEIELLQALGRKTKLSITLPDWPGARVVRRMLEGPQCEVVQHIGDSETELAPVVVSAVDPSREAEEIALRLLEARGKGYLWRDMGIIMRSRHPYVPLIERALSRAGIPFRLYFGSPLTGTSVFKFVEGLVKAVLSGWEYRQTWTALQSVAHSLGIAATSSALERVVIEALPGKGIEGFGELVRSVALPGVTSIQKLLQEWSQFSSWSIESAQPREWARRLGALTVQMGLPIASPQISRLQLEGDRLRGAALRTLCDGLSSTARLLPDAPLSLESFWDSASCLLSSTPIRIRDTRRDVVHVMDVHEARQWQLPVVFVCGLTEGAFPKRAFPDPLLKDDLRERLKDQGYPLLTSADRDREETFLCDFARTRATAELTLSYPLFGLDGKPALRAFILGTVSEATAEARSLRISPAARIAAAQRYNLQSEDVLAAIRKDNVTFKPTSLEDFLQCPFRFFSRRTLRLREWPPEPEDRIGPLALGNVIHNAISRWHKVGQAGSLVALTEEEWHRELQRLRVPPNWRTEVLWLLLERSARFYMAKGLLDTGWTVTTEKELSLSIDGFRLKGRADRVDYDAQNNCRVIEFKFAGSTGLKKKKAKLAAGLLVQAPLYALALQQEGASPVSYSIVALRGDTQVQTYEGAEQVEAGILLASQKAADAAFRITQGDIRVMPADIEACGYCSYQDACRRRDEARELDAADAAGTQALT